MEEQEKAIVLRPEQLPLIVGTWTVGEVRRALAILDNWLNNIPLSSEPNEEPKAS